MEKEEVDYQLVPSQNHRQNAVKRAIIMQKSHFLAGLSSVDTKSPIHIWDWILDQAGQTLNLPHPECIEPTMLAYSMILGAFYFNCTLITLPVTKVVVHKKLGKRGSWALHDR